MSQRLSGCLYACLCPRHGWDWLWTKYFTLFSRPLQLYVLN